MRERPPPRSSRAAGSEAESARFRFEYEAPLACPDRAVFLDSIRDRTPRPRLAEGDDQAFTLRIKLKIDAEEASGELEVREPAGGEQRTSVSTRTCGEVASALA